MRAVRCALGVLLAGLLALGGPAPAGADDSYLLRPQTRLKVMILEWIAATGEYKEWSALDGEYLVSPAGTISIPLLGEIVVANDTTRSVGDRIAALLKEKTGLATPPTATVEVVKYPAIYVTGVVERPGELEFRPALTVMQAVAMAGGRQRGTNPLGYSELEQIRYVGELSRGELQLKQLMARRARLVAEAGGASAVEMPPELSTQAADTATQQIAQRELSLFAARAEALTRQLDSLDELKVLLGNEIKVLEEKTAVQDRQIEIAQKELSNISSLVDRGTLAKSRETTLERVVADLSSNKLDLVVATMRARQKVSETQRDAVTLQGQYRTEAARDLQLVEAEIGDTKLKRNTALQLLEASGASLSQDRALKSLELQPVEYWLTREGDLRSPFKVQQTAVLEPGDVLSVRYDIPAGIAGLLQVSVNSEPPR
ncbi:MULTISPECIES: polysaccharide biosynthesis/export family protein [Alphaproteobacteria]|uniref:Exopolysaccharide biosynthesis protein n=2 Tax=Alphaproteobacteria TaxID=28211 RepID=A0A512HN49_9HYPH|nr:MULTISPECIES: polysaccharide biosynthesis/export family protein [Alphaproteobacteria]GEO86876.1 exopolysaccharide biosynthesis protein [Ciceribacter naphthalenivorans]GLR24020.1 exopolysaccharide biosynthesis protein [Ciceribacter naphthalenivorans]GLT06876.1 exopolysaccharide biosynthesis protein [Sphingomonas psychrolutea]